MVTKTVEKTVVMTKYGTPLTVMERPGGLGTLEEYHAELDELRKQYGHLLAKQTPEEYLAERRREAEREWQE